MGRVLNLMAFVIFATTLFMRSVDPVIPQIAQGLNVTPTTAALLSTGFTLPYALIQPVLGALDHSETILASVMRKARFWETHAKLPLNERQRAVLNRLLNGFDGKLTSSKWAKLAKCSQDTALRDIDDLVKQGVLVKDAAGGDDTSYSLAPQG